MNRTLICILAALAVTIGARAEDASGPNLDVAGLKIGMGVHEAMATLKAENPHFYINLSPHQLEGFSAPLHPFVSGEQPIGPNNDAESIDLLFTMPPNKEVVWGIKRAIQSYRFQENRPTTEKIPPCGSAGKIRLGECSRARIRARRYSPGCTTTRGNCYPPIKPNNSTRAAPAFCKPISAMRTCRALTISRRASTAHRNAVPSS